MSNLRNSPVSMSNLRVKGHSISNAGQWCKVGLHRQMSWRCVVQKSRSEALAKKHTDVKGSCFQIEKTENKSIWGICKRENLNIYNTLRTHEK